MQPVTLDLRLAPVWDAIGAAWEPCQAALRRAGLDRDERQALCMVARELLENAVKYGAYGDGDEVRLSLRAGEAEVTIEVRSPLGDGLDRVRRIDDILRALRAGDDPLQAYVERVRAVARDPAGAAGGLGLARIACEGRGLLDVRLEGAHTLAVSAVYLRDGGPA